MTRNRCSIVTPDPGPDDSTRSEDETLRASLLSGACPKKDTKLMARIIALKEPSRCIG